jgi:hypothetical protein
MVGRGTAAVAVQVDLLAPTIAPQTRVWRLFPGQSYQFLQSFLEQRIGFLDFPGLQLPGNLTEANDLIPRIARSQAINDLLRRVGPEAAGNLDLNATADLNLDNFSRAYATGHRNRLRSALINFYQEAKMGDYIVLPEPVYMSTVRVGRITTNRRVSGFYHRRYVNVPIPARTIDWVSSIPEHMISVPLSRSLRHEHPFTLLPNSLHVEVFSLVHGSFVYGDRHVSTIYNDLDDFLDADAALLGAVSRLSAAATQSLDLAHGGLDVADLIDILLRSPPIEYTCSQATDIHSLGFNRYVSSAIVALVIAAVVGATIEFGAFNTKASLETELPQLQIINTAPGADPACTARVSEATKRVLHVLGTDRTWSLCEAARDAQRRAGLRSSAPGHHQ